MNQNKNSPTSEIASTGASDLKNVVRTVFVEESRLVDRTASIFTKKISSIQEVLKNYLKKYSVWAIFGISAGVGLLIGIVCEVR